MFGLGPATKIYIAVEAIDMRKGFDGLYGLVRDRLGQDPLSGHLFLFTNRTKTRLKALVWEKRIRTFDARTNCSDRPPHLSDVTGRSPHKTTSARDVRFA